MKKQYKSGIKLIRRNTYTYYKCQTYIPNKKQLIYDKISKLIHRQIIFANNEDMSVFRTSVLTTFNRVFNSMFKA